MAQLYERGDVVTWNWGDGEKRGVITSIHTRPVSKKIKGEKIRREGNPGAPAYSIKQANGGLALCCGSELNPA